MGLHEAFVVPDGYRLFEGGLNAGTLRDPKVLRYWRGLAADETALLFGWVRKFGDDLQELHTDVPVGMIPDTSGSEVPGWMDRMCCASHPLRIDAVVKLLGVWWVIEVKVNAGYQALGQVLTYGHYAHLASPQLGKVSLGIVTDDVQECIRPVFECFGVRVWEV